MSCRSAANVERSPTAYHRGEEVRATPVPSWHWLTRVRAVQAFGRCNGSLDSLRNRPALESVAVGAVCATTLQRAARRRQWEPPESSRRRR